MLAAVFHDLGDLRVEDREEPEVTDDSALMRVHACAVCGSDIRNLNFGNKRIKAPCIMGHEVAGEIVAVGKNVTDFKVGDRVAVGGDIPCGECGPCQNGYPNCCAENLAIGHQFPGGFAEMMPLVPLMLRGGPVCRIPDSLDFDSATLAEPLACCINGLELASLHIGDSVAIIGAGPIGCLMIQLAKTMGASRVVLVQRSEARFELAKRFGADDYILAPDGNAGEAIAELTHGEGVDVVVVACGSVEAQEEAIRMVKPRGRINFFGGLKKGTRPISFDSNIVHYKECFISGAHGAAPRHHRTAVELIGTGRIESELFLTHRFPLKEIHDAFKVQENRTGMKVVVNP